MYTSLKNRREDMFIIYRTSFIFLTCIPYVIKCQTCPASMLTLRSVEKCPTTEQEWGAASSRKSCNFLADYKGCGKILVYHCLLNQWRNETLEVCAPTWYMSGFCAMFNTVEQRVIDNFNMDCTKFINGSCPSRYLSSDAYKYQNCYKKHKVSTLTMDQDGEKQLKVTDNQLQLIVPLVLLSIGVLVLSVVLALTCKGNIGNGVGHRNNSTPNVESEPLETINSNRETEDENTRVAENVDDRTSEKTALIPNKDEKVDITQSRSVAEQRTCNYQGRHVHTVSETTADKVDTTQTRSVAELKKYHNEVVGKITEEKQFLKKLSSQSAHTGNNGKSNNKEMGEDNLSIKTASDDGEDSRRSSQSESSEKDKEVRAEKIAEQKALGSNSQGESSDNEGERLTNDYTNENETPQVPSEDLYPRKNNSETVDPISVTVQGNQDPANMTTNIPTEDDIQETL